MNYFPEFDLTTTENSQGFNLFEQQERIMEFSPLEGFFNMHSVPFPYQSEQLCFNDFPNLEDLSSNFACLEYNLSPIYEGLVIDQKPLSVNSPAPPHAHCENVADNLDELSMVVASGSSHSCKNEERVEGTRPNDRRRRTCSLELDEIRNHFDVPITKAAKQMNVGLSLLKKRCRELNIMRWPHRKIKSLNSLIYNVKELGLTEEVAMLEKHKLLVEKLPDMELSEETKRLRQACFKENYKRRRHLVIQAGL
ncbi:hypothetical protein L6164_016340 [Bauhinia variegata]|uniref:Uncharacterized protein n=1 Tax=Bauhinia variegata TaxID=167791 RepID=A0ACB9NSM7_BAUVA|nr:hypothetical protein L6164_016340 [Bauhinia variegata]